MEESNPKFAEQSDKVVRTLATMLDYLSLNGTPKVSEHNGKLAVKISSDDAGRIIGRRGQTLESLQLLLNRIMFKTDDTFPHIMLDIDGYSNGERDRRSGRNRDNGGNQERSERRGRNRNSESGMSEEQLEQQAIDAAKEVKRWGEPIKLPEMNAHDRRIVHLALQNDPDVTTESEGEGAMKKVVVLLRKKECCCNE